MGKVELLADWKRRCGYTQNPTPEQTEAMDDIRDGACEFGQQLIDLLADGPELRRALNKVQEAKTLAVSSVLLRGLAQDETRSEP